MRKALLIGLLAAATCTVADYQPTGTKCYFENVSVLKDGSPQNKGRYSPVKGDIVIAPE